MRNENVNKPQNQQSCQNAVRASTVFKKECSHKFHSVYYGSEWVVECEKCEKDVYDLYNIEDGTEIINKMIYENSK